MYAADTTMKQLSTENGDTKRSCVAQLRTTFQLNLYTAEMNGTTKQAYMLVCCEQVSLVFNAALTFHFSASRRSKI